jgi:hypothetical protein
MPKKLESCIKKVKAKGSKKKKVDPYAICIASTGQKPHRKGK